MYMYQGLQLIMLICRQYQTKFSSISILQRKEITLLILYIYLAFTGPREVKQTLISSTMRHIVYSSGGQLMIEMSDHFHPRR